jgi:hypothetical protein
MVSAVVFMSGGRSARTPSDPLIALSRSLGSLVKASVEGLIRDVTIAGPSGLELGTIADHAGCAFVEGGREADWLGQALALAKGPACLVLQAGYIPGPGFAEELRDIIDRPLRMPGFLRAEPEHWPWRFFPVWAPIAGLVASLDALQTHPERDFHRMTRSLPGQNLRSKMHWIG